MEPRLLPIPLHLLGAAFLIYRGMQTTHAASKQFAMRLAICTLLLLLPSYNGAQEAVGIPLGWWLYVLGNVSVHIVVVFSYFLTHEFLNHRTYTVKEMLTHPVSLGCALITLTMVSVDIIRKDHFVSISDPATFERSVEYGLAQILACSVGLYVDILILNIYARFLKNKKDPIFVSRCIMFMMACALNILAMILIMSNTIVSLVSDNPYRISIFYFVQNDLRPAIYLFLFAGLAIPQSIFRVMLKPLDVYLTRRTSYRQALLMYLHLRMIQVVPFVHLSGDQLDDISMLIEISDARLVILSHAPRASVMNAYDEAKLVFELIRSKAMPSGPGRYTPRAVQGNLAKHILNVANELKRLERDEDCRPSGYPNPHYQ